MEGDPQVAKTVYTGTYLKTKVTQNLRNIHLLVVLYICLKQMLGNENIFNTITLLASSCSGGICDLMKKSLEKSTSATLGKILKKSSCTKVFLQ